MVGVIQIMILNLRLYFTIFIGVGGGTYNMVYYANMTCIMLFVVK